LNVSQHNVESSIAYLKFGANKKPPNCVAAFGQMCIIYSSYFTISKWNIMGFILMRRPIASSSESPTDNTLELPSEYFATPLLLVSGFVHFYFLFFFHRVCTSLFKLTKYLHFCQVCFKVKNTYNNPLTTNNKKMKKKTKAKKSAKKSVKKVSKNTNSKITPLGDRILLKPFAQEKETITASGIIIPETVSKEKPEQGTVVAVGEGRWESGKRVPMDIKVGDRVVFSRYGYEEVKLDGIEYYILKEENILAVIKN
jgi:chaperonin GroES